VKAVLRKIKFFAGIFFQLLLVAAVFLVGWGMSFTSIDLGKAKTTTGVITSTTIQQNKRSRAIPGQLDLVIPFDSADAGFWIYLSSQNYADLLSLTVGRSTIFHSSRPGLNGYYTACRVECSGKIIYSKSEYEKKEKLAGRFIVLPGVKISTIAAKSLRLIL
jgi:hypothetical protein